MTLETEVEEAFLSSVIALHGDAPGFLSKLKEQAWLAFNAKGLPQRKDEDFKYIKMRALYSRSLHASFPSEISSVDLEAMILPQCKESRIVFVNGHFREELSCFPTGPSLMPLQKAARTFNAFFVSHWGFLIKEETNPFYLLNTSLEKDGAFIYVPPNIQVQTPIQVLFIYTEDSPAMLVQPRLSVFLGALSELNLIFTHKFLGGKGHTINLASDFHLEPGASLRCEEIIDEMPDALYHMESVRARLKRDSKFTWININRGAMTLRSDYKIWLHGENSEASLDGLAMLEGKKESHAHIMLIHEGQYTRSRQLFKNILKDLSRSSFEGQIIVEKDAMKTDAFQLNNNLLLSERAHADSKPMLKIFADDVKASHGATVGSLDKEELFYLRSRGLPKEAAKRFLTEGFCQEVFDMLKL